MLCKRCELLDSTSLFPSVPCRGCSSLGSGFQRRVPERWRQHLHFRRSSTGSICRLPCPDAGTSDGYRLTVDWERVAPVGPSAGPNLGLVNTTWDGRRLLEGPVWVEVLPEAQGALDPDRSRHRTQTRETLEFGRDFIKYLASTIQKAFGNQSRQCIAVVMKAQQAS